MRCGYAFLFVLLPLVLQPARADQFQSDDVAMDRLIAASSATGLLPVGADGPEIRVWIEDVLLGIVHGYVVSKTAVLECDPTWRINTTDAAKNIKLSRCKSMPMRARSREAFDLFRDLAKLDGQNLGCGVRDGSQVFVEGRNPSQRFTLFASNPQWCTDSDSLLVARLLSVLGVIIR
jgi:hypothetical protein